MASPERNVQLRYIILDACMAQAARDESVVWTKEALLQEVNRQLREDNPSTKPIAMRTLEKDIVDMESTYGLRIIRCLLYTSPSPRDLSTSRMPSSA